MENRKKSKTKQIELPEQVLQHIQSFLTTKEAAVTSVVSKSWYNSWLSRPNLDFNELDFPNVPSPRINFTFLNFVTNALDKYRELNLGLEKFKLCMTPSSVKPSSVATESIIKAMTIGVKNVDIVMKDAHEKFILPKEVLECESLKSLSVFGCEIGVICKGSVKCTKLESLSLSFVNIDDEMLMDLINECPLIESLSLYRCKGYLGNVNFSGLVRLQKLSISGQLSDNHQVGMVELDVPVMGCLSDVAGFGKLRCLVLEYVEIDSMLFHDFSNKFPCIEDLTILSCSGYTRLDISSPSLKYVTLDSGWETHEVRLDVPNILVFKFKTVAIPYLTVTGSSSNWESDISIECWTPDRLDILWFRELNNFLTNLSGSKISLSIMLSKDPMSKRLLHFQDLPNPPIVENLTLETKYSGGVCSLFLDALFWSLQPKVITQRFFPRLHKFGRAANKYNLLQRKRYNKLFQLLYNKIMDLENNIGSTSSGTMICWNKLEEVNAESFDDTFMSWQQHRPWKTFLDDINIMIPKEEAQIRFRLKWVPR